jgi:hypothetical protein
MLPKYELRRETLGRVTAIDVGRPWTSLAAAVIAQAMDDACDAASEMVEERRCARAWFERGDSIYFSVMTTDTVSVEDILQMARRTIAESDAKPQRRYEAALKDALAQEEARAKERRSAAKERIRGKYESQ